MKRLLNLKTLLTITAASLSSMAFAGGYQWTTDEKTIEGHVVSSKAAAYREGLNMIMYFENLDSRQLSRFLTSQTDEADRSSVSIEDATVFVDEYLKRNGDIVYQPIMNVSYSYRSLISPDRQ
ncbi:DUF3316 domain-containing protein [Vibrio sp. SM6]|uniref:DUF3316 domain-containing protein n=1 Tax=Vibrio agarilyticus TaxID=2726741 RepID=A0A7X8TM42_9VIBR|nr:DUF3316 domain-containing protein [Vibrio agarilyticus]NLS11292.1 DUF3316 domain-containing protein [Vibrio agarilyticus]